MWGGSTEHGGTLPSHRNNKLSVFSAGLRGKPSDYDGLVLWRQDRLASQRSKRDGSVKIRLVIDLRRTGVNGLTHVTQKVTLPRVKDFAISVVTSLWRPTSRICEASTCAASSSLMPSRPSQFASTKRVFCLPDRLRLVHLQSHPVRPCLQSLVVGASFSSSLTSGSANVPAGGARIPWVSQGPPLRGRVLSVMLLLLWAVMGANLSWRKGKCGQCTCWRRYHDERP